MSRSVLVTNKVRLASFGAAGTMLASALFPTAFAYAAQATPALNTNASATSTDVSAGTVANALSHASGVLADTSQVATTSDSHTALKSAVGGATVTVPKTASTGVAVNGANGQLLDIQLPNASQDSTATQVANGTVAYAGTNGSANAVQTTNDGGVRMLTVIDSPSAPTTYDYRISVPNGGRIQLTNDGGAVILNARSAVIASVATPWAHDANGKTIQTYFTTDGTTLTQHILHNVPGVVYPVTADPRFSWGWNGLTVYMNKGETNFVAWVSGGVSAYFGWTGLPGVAGYAIVTGAQWATQHGYCLAFTEGWWAFSHNGIPYIWVYRC